MPDDRTRPTRLVYSTSIGRVCPTCQAAWGSCQCQDTETPLGDGRVRVGRSTKGRGGKAVTVITGLPLTASELKSLAKRLKQQCGSGGTVRNGTIEIQGEHREVLTRRLRELGYQATSSGG